MTSEIDGKQFANMIISAANHLNNNKTAVDKLNVFPVPDGDTGTNMSMTFTAAADEIRKYVTGSIGEVAKTLSGASLRGARGNSGVILSQFCRGIAQSLSGKATANAKELAAAMDAGVQTAYKAVMRPTEGTILTVARESAKAAVESAELKEDIEAVMGDMLQEARASLSRTPELLPVLKESGVVDSGGAGLVVILEGAYHALTTGGLIELEGAIASVASTSAAQAEIPSDNIKFAYCTEFIIDKKSPDVNVARFSEIIDSKGDCKLVIDDDEIVKVHIHTNNPGFVIEEAIKLGALSKIKIDNMKLQHSTILNEKTPGSDINSDTGQETSPKPYGFVAVAAGAGLEQIFQDFGADEIIEGGQSMNPSTEDILSAIERISADCIYVLPNNKNIILAASQAQSLTEKHVVVLPAKSIPQGIAAMLAFLPHLEEAENTQEMTDAIGRVKTGQVTYAVRNTNVGSKEIKEGDCIGIADGEISVVGDSTEDVCKELISMLVEEESSVISVFYGSDISQEVSDTLQTELEDVYPEMDVMVQSGGQPLYYYIISVE